MNAKSFALTGLCFAMCQSPALESHASDIKVFLLGGQSNMLGRSSVSGLPASLQGVQSDVLLFGGSDGTAGTTLVSLQPEIMDQPTAALIHDMKRRGLLEHTLVVWCTEFGRMPFLQANGTGRDHNPSAFTCFLAGAGIKKGYSYGASDEFGFKIADKPTTVYDFNATVLHLMGLDHERLSYYHNGLERRLTNVHGHVVKDVLA